MRRCVRAVCLVVLAALSAQAQKAPPRKKLVEDVRLDAVTEDFPGIWRFAVGPRGQMAVFIRDDQVARVYDEKGRRTASFGRKGSGPGESRTVLKMAWKGDTLWTYDNGTKRLTFISPDGKLLRHQTLLPAMSLAKRDSAGDPLKSLYFYSPIALAPDGRVFAWADVGTGRDGKGITTTEAAFILTDETGSRRSLVGRPGRSAAPAQVSVIGEDGKTAIARVPFSAFPSQAYASDGSRYGFLTEDLSGRTGKYTINVVRTTGDTVFSRTYSYAGTPIPSAVRDSALDAIAHEKNANGTARYPSAISANLAELARPLTPQIWSSVSGLTIGADNLTWVSMRATAAGTEAIALDDKGNPVMSVMLPPRMILAHATATHIWVIAKDQDDLESVVRFRIR